MSSSSTEQQQPQQEQQPQQLEPQQQTQEIVASTVVVSSSPPVTTDTPFSTQLKNVISIQDAVESVIAPSEEETTPKIEQQQPVVQAVVQQLPKAPTPKSQVKGAQIKEQTSQVTPSQQQAPSTSTALRNSGNHSGSNSSNNSHQGNSTGSISSRLNDSVTQNLDILETHMSQAINQVGSFVSGVFSLPRSNSNSQTTSNEQSSTSLHNQIPYFQPPFTQDRAMLREISAGKKSTVFLQLREWDAQRINALNIHRNILESFLARIDQRMKQSQDNLTSVSVFIRSIANSIQANVNTAQTPLPQITKYIYSDIYDKLFEAAQQYEAQTALKTSVIQTFKQRIDAEILAGLILPDAEHYNRTVNQIRNNLTNLKQSLLEQQSTVAKKSKSLRETYTTNAQILPNKRAKKDVMKKLYQFLRACQDLRDIQCVVAKATVGYWRKAIDLEKQRAKVIKEALMKLLSLHETMIVNQASITSFVTDTVASLIKEQNFSEEYIASKLGFGEIVTAEDQAFIAKELEKRQIRSTESEPQYHAKDITVNDVYQYLMKINYDTFDDAGLAQKKMILQREVGQQMKQSTVVITPDAFLLCYDQEKKQRSRNNGGDGAEESKADDDDEDQIEEESLPLYMTKPTVSFAIQSIKLKRNGLSLEVKSVPTSSLMSLIRQNHNEIKLLFKTNDNLEEFVSVLVASSELQ